MIRIRYAAVAVAAAGAVLATAMQVLAADGPTAVDAAADTTQTLVAADGDNAARSTLATCPQSCEGNANGWRDAFVEFPVALPAGATGVTAHLQLYSWNPYAASVAAYAASGGARAATPVTARATVGAALSSVPSVVKGYNDWDVSAAVKAGGTVTFTLRQTGLSSRVYWASRENATATLRPRLVLSYTTGGGAYRLVWQDEFDGSALDTANWQARNSLVDFDRACITNRPQNVFVSGGMLTLRAQREDRTCGGEARHYTTGYLDTIHLHSWTYGRFEVRAKSPGVPGASTGLWPAFWLRPEDGGNGELDVVELPGGEAYYKLATQAIFRDYTPTKQDQRKWISAAGYPADGFHVYATEWTATELVWYVDGVEIWRRSPATTSWYTEVFNKPYNLRLNFQVGGWLGDPTASTAFPADFQVDYVRVYQK